MSDSFSQLFGNLIQIFLFSRQEFHKMNFTWKIRRKEGLQKKLFVILFNAFLKIALALFGNQDDEILFGAC